MAEPHDWREGRRLRAWELYQRGWSQKRIADALGVSQGAVNHWIKRARDGGAAALRRRRAAAPLPEPAPEQQPGPPGLLEQAPQDWNPLPAAGAAEPAVPDQPLPKTRSEWIYEGLKEKILSGQYQPLQRLVADQIAREIGTSVIPVREALLRLESEGLVELQPYVGARVAAFSIEDVCELFEIRKLLEPLLAESAIAGVTREGLRELTELCEAMDRALAAGDMRAYSRLNFQFHTRMYQMSPWRTLYQIVISVWERSARSRWVLRLAPQQALASQVEHRQMLAALGSGDASSLREICARQKERTFQLYLSVVGREAQRRTEADDGLQASQDSAAGGGLYDWFR